ncbi:MAG: hypothetical protein EZS28_023519 [Streblomastix strix]|uniref:Uncharacterized protein n=1 Tax=Streblomastix strix TaxID=222440 RepID=A0A5J4VF10_9EUKA|nr:MAG: hypothetical protein EZS28_023519 [Streblomastix strix]
MSFILYQIYAAENKAVAKHYQKLGEDVDTAFDAIEQQYPENHPTQETMEIWFDKLNSDNFSIFNEIRTGCHKIPNLENQIQAFLQIDKHATVGRMALQLVVAEFTVLNRHLNGLHYLLLKGKSVSHQLTLEQKQKPIEQAAQINAQLKFAANQNYQFEITGHESWVYYTNPHPNQWALKGTSYETQEQVTRVTMKVMLIIILSGMQFLQKSFLPQCEHINAHSFINNMFNPLFDTIETQYPNIEQYILSNIVNVPDHNVLLSRNILEEISLYRIPHPLNSLDISPSYFRAFGDLMNKMIGVTFHDGAEIEQFFEEWCGHQTSAKLQKVMQNWLERCDIVIAQRDEYIK